MKTDQNCPPLGRIVNVYLNGWRICVVLDRGREWTTVLDCGTLQKYRLSIDQRAAPKTIKPLSIMPDRIISLIERQRSTFDRCGVKYSHNAVDEALAMLLNKKIELPTRAAVPVSINPVYNVIKNKAEKERTVCKPGAPSALTDFDQDTFTKMKLAMSETVRGDRNDKLDLNSLAAVGEANGIDMSRCEHLNPGQRRMYVGNRLRALLLKGALIKIGGFDFKR